MVARSGQADRMFWVGGAIHVHGWEAALLALPLADESVIISKLSSGHGKAVHNTNNTHGAPRLNM